MAADRPLALFFHQARKGPSTQVDGRLDAARAGPDAARVLDVFDDVARGVVRASGSPAIDGVPVPTNQLDVGPDSTP